MGAWLIVDGTEVAGIVVPNVPLSDMSLFACAGYKGLRGRRGVAYPVAHDDVAADFAAPSGYGMADAKDRGQCGPPIPPKPGAPGLDQSPAWLAWVGAEPALAELALESSVHRERRVVALAWQIRGYVEELNLEPQQTDLPSSIVTFESDDPDGLVGRLGDVVIRTTSKLGRVRLGFRVYDDENDVDLVCQVLGQSFRRNRTIQRQESQS